MKRLLLSLACALFASMAMAQSVAFTVTTVPCHNDGVLTVNVTGMTPPLTVDWITYGTSGTTTTHTGVSGLSDALTSYSGGPVDVRVTDATSAIVYNYYGGMPPFTYSVSSTPAVCPALGSATVTVTGGTGPYTYQWFDISTMATVSTSNPASLAAGNYGVTITDALGCTYGSTVNMDSIMIWSIAPFTVPVTTTVANCTNGTATVGTITGGTLPYSYSWSTGATSSSITGLTMGSYNVTVTDASGCSAMGYAYVSQAITINVPTTPTPATCLASDGAIIAFGSGGTPPYTYLWSNGATTQSQTGLLSGSYYVTATDANGCIGQGYGYISASTPITATYSTTASSCVSPTGTATLTLSGGTTPYTTNWYTTPPQTGLTATALPSGYYGFHITDAVGCVQSGTVYIPPVNVITASFSSTSALCLLSNGALSVTPSGGTTPYTYSWSTGATTSGITSVPGGSYSVHITDAIGCNVTKWGYVSVNSPVGLGLASTPATCIFNNDGSITATPWGGTSPYTYSWSTGGTSGTISSLRTGSYYVRVTDAVGCTVDDYAYVGYNPANTSCYCTIEGTVYHDANNNCTQDVGEAGIPNIQIYCSGIGYTYTDMSGHYSFIVPSGSYTITETVLAFYPLSTCQANNIPVTATATTGCVIPVDFANAINPIHDVHISTWDFTAAIPGHTYTQKVIVTNDGTVTESGILSGYTTDGQIYVPTFSPSGVYSGSPYWYSTPSTFPTLNPGFSSTYYLNYFVPGSVPLGTTVVFKDTVSYTSPISNWLTDYSPWNNVDYFTTRTVASYDPNFKEVYPKGTGPTGIISYKDSILEYMVHFQNTGTAPAENVIVLDTIDNNLNWTSLKPEYMSGKCKVTLTQSGAYKIAKFEFDNINLPTSTSDPVTSNGLFTYTIKLKPGLPMGTQIKNNASIYFDYNAPVKTNTTVNTIGHTVGVPQVNGEQSNTFTIFPNPADKSFSAILDFDKAGSADLKVYDMAGRAVISKTIELQGGSQTVGTDVSNIAPGVYFVTLTADGKTQTQKLVIMK